MHKNSLPSAPIPIDSKVFGYGPMLPFVVGALGSWFMPSLQATATGLTIIWGALIISFLGGVRRGFGFGDPRASARTEILTMIVYVSIGGVSLILAALRLLVPSVAVLALGYVIVPIADFRSAKTGDVPAHFASLRPPQMSIAALSLIAILARLLVR